MSALDHHRAGSGPPLLLLHGIGSTWRAWRPVLASLERRFEVLAVDMPGFGRSPPPPPGVQPSPELLATAVERELEDAGWSDTHVAGNSLGGWVAMELARRGRARSVVGLSPAGLKTPREDAYAQSQLRLTHAVVRLLRGRERLLRPLPARVLLCRLMYGRPWRLDPDWLVEQMRLLADSPAFDAVRRETAGRHPRGLDTVRCPVLIAWGTRDRLLLPRQARRWVELIPGAELRWLRGLGHVPMPDDPELVASTIADFAEAAERRALSVARP